MLNDKSHHAGKRVAESISPAAPLLPADSENSQLTLALKKYLKTKDIELIWEAYRFGDAAHQGQMRKSGEPYITHPVSVALILAGLHLDTPTIIAALLHDVVEDTGITKEEVADKFGAQVAELVDGLSKLDKIEFQSVTEAQAENFRKMLLAMSQDVRVILVKLADRLHNMQTLDVMKPEKPLGREPQLVVEGQEIHMAPRVGCSRNGNPAAAARTENGIGHWSEGPFQR